MYAVIESGGKQYSVTKGQKLKLEKLNAAVDEKIEFENLLMVSDGEKVSVGQPYVATAKVQAVVKAHGRGDKIRIIKHKRRKHHMKRQGHRQDYTQVEITNIVA